MKRTALKKLTWHNRFTYVKNVVCEADDLGQKGSRFQIVRFKPGKAIATHYHKKAYEIFYIHSGTGRLVMITWFAQNDIIPLQPITAPFHN